MTYYGHTCSTRSCIVAKSYFTYGLTHDFPKFELVVETLISEPLAARGTIFASECCLVVFGADTNLNFLPPTLNLTTQLPKLRPESELRATDSERLQPWRRLNSSCGSVRFCVVPIDRLDVLCSLLAHVLVIDAVCP